MKIFTPLLSAVILMAGCAAPKTNYFISINPNEQSNATEIIGFKSTPANISITQTIQTALPNADNNYSFLWKDWNADGYDDLIAINRAGIKTCLIYILDGATGFKSFLLQQQINFPRTDASTDFAMTNWNEDAIPDLIIFHRNGILPVEVQILSGSANNNDPAFFTQLDGFTLPDADPGMDKIYTFSDYNMDNIEDLIIINTQEGPVTINYYNRNDQFAHLADSKTTALVNGKGKYKFAFGEAMTQGLKDLYVIDYADPAAPKILISYYLVGFTANAYEAAIQLKNVLPQSAFFTGEKIIDPSTISTPVINTTFNPNPLLPGNGPKNLKLFDGQWETNYLLHSDDENGISGIIIKYEAEKTKSTLNGLNEELRITFEDNYSISCTGENGNLEFKETASGKILEDADLSVEDNQFIYLTLDGNKYKFKRYIEDLSYNSVRIVNEAAYVSTVFAEWQYTGFGGKILNGKLDSTNLDALIFTSTFILVPKTAYNFNIHVKVVLGVNWSFLGGADDSQFNIVTSADGGCYRIKGTTLNPGYDNDCPQNSAFDEALQNPYVQAFIKYAKGLNMDKISDDLQKIASSKDYNALMELLGEDLLNELSKVSQKQSESGNLFNAPDKNFEFINPVFPETFYKNGIVENQDRKNNSSVSDNMFVIAPDTIIYDENEEAPYSITIGFNGSAEFFIIGGTVETGVVIPCCNPSKAFKEYGDVYNYPDLRLFNTIGYTGGLEVGVAGGVSLGFSMGGPFSQDESTELAFDITAVEGVGGGITFSFNRDHSTPSGLAFSGIGLFLDGGLKLGASGQIIHTWFYNLDDMEPDNTYYDPSDD